MARGLRTVFLAWALLVALAPFRASALDPPPEVARARTQAEAAVSAWDAARRRLETTRANSEVLAHRIAALKRIQGQGKAGGDAELGRLLRESLAVDATLTEDARAVESAADRVRDRVAAAIALVDAKIEELRPRLHQGELEAKKAAARSINELRALRRDVKDLAGSLREPEPLPKEWSRYEVTIDPLDGPKELSEKADFIEDTRDRFRKKLEELRKVIRDARAEQDISIAAAEFQRDTHLFDEEARSARVSRQASGGRGAIAPEKSSKVEGDSHGTPPSTPQTGADSQVAPATPVGDPGPPPPGTGGEVPLSTPPPPPPGNPAGTPSRTPPPTPSPAFGATTVTKANPNVLLNLRVESLDASSSNVAQLEGLALDLERLQQLLDGRSKELRRRAEQLQHDEARALGTK